MTRRILVTGGFGFLGSHLVEHLARDGDAHVHVVDDLSTGMTLLQARSFVASLPAVGALGVVTYDVGCIADWLLLPRSWRFDEIYHLASVVGPVGILRHAGGIVGRVVEDAYRVIEFAREHGARLCDVSTSEVYGGGRRGACSESDVRVVPAEVTVRLEYAVAKLAAEVAIINTARVSDLSAVIVRPFNVAGPRQSAAGGFVLPRFVGQALSGQPLTVYGDGGAVRAFTHAADVADGLARAVRRRVDRAGRAVGVYNLGNARNRTTILELARLVLRETGSDSPIAHVQPQELHGALFAEANDKYPDGDLAARELDWHPTRDLGSIVREVVRDARRSRSGDASSST